MIAACTEKESTKTDWSVLLCGLLQFVLGYLIVGWIWSIIWGVKIYSKSQVKVRVVNTSNDENSIQVTSMP